MLLVVDNKGKHTKNLIEYLKKRKIEYIKVDKTSELDKIMTNDFKGVILSGGPLSYDANINIDDVDINLVVLVDMSVPILGICFGMQSIIEAWHGKVRKMKASDMDPTNIQVIKDNTLFDGLPDKFEVFEYHHDCALEVPYNFELIAKSDECPVEAIKHKKKPIYGVQFHPEASGETGYKILDNFMKICGIKLTT